MSHRERCSKRLLLKKKMLATPHPNGTTRVPLLTYTSYPTNAARFSVRIKRMQGAPAGLHFLTPSRQVHDIPELLDAIAVYLSWEELIILGHSGQHAQDIVERIIRHRLIVLMKPFILNLDAYLVDFFDLLQETNGGIVGSLVWRLMAACDTTLDGNVLKDLNIIVPGGGHFTCKWLSFLFKIGYRSVVNQDCLGWYNWAIKRTLIFEKEGRFISVTESKTKSIMPIVISSPLTSMFNVLTYSRIYCFYPFLFRQRIAVRTTTDITLTMVSRLRDKGIDLSWSTIEWTFPCGEACPVLWRRTENLSGIGVARWGGISGHLDTSGIPSTQQELGHAHYKWRLGKHNRPVSFTNWKPATLRAAFVCNIIS
ncbi:hypothetical protein GALMADRAFT_211580 [Galerina marginata CBS 339.88]|uniref:Uncharacterized protein n=1 Tax=Galerina marginata (strain CBS 339.88) TaxID=685588 RepID=A0A067T8P3_GALM3|nr:hypothetical protein GALMADRAFT_211580 [Galerina marginata CBS 339.88]